MPSSDSAAVKESRSGAPTATVNGINIHSAYDPAREASRFLDRAGMNGNDVSTVIVVGPGLGYLLSELRDRMPNLTIIALFLSHWTQEHAIAGGTSHWSPDSLERLRSFLERELSHRSIEECAVLTWPPTQQAWSELAKEVEAELREYFQERQGSALTEAFFGVRWILNSVANLKCAPTFTSLPPSTGTVIIAASGPTLEASIPVIRDVRKRVSLWALPSAVAPLHASGLAPDLVVLTDPGYYATVHLRPLSRRSRIPVAMPLTAARGVWRHTDTIIPILQGMPYEEFAAQGGADCGARLPEMGTVAATALELALHCGHSHVVFAGLDMCSVDLRTHAQPDLLQHYRAPLPHRLSPELGTRFGALARHTRVARRAFAPRSLNTYAAWFRRRAAELAGTLYRLRPSPIELGIPEITEEEILRLPKGKSGRSPVRGEGPGRPRRDAAAHALVEKVSTDLQYAVRSASGDVLPEPDARWLLRVLDLPSERALRHSASSIERQEAIERLERIALSTIARLRAHATAANAGTSGRPAS